jgi:hypothetical protein
MAPEVKIAKNSKLPKTLENCFEPVGKGGWPPISIWIMYGLYNKGHIWELFQEGHSESVSEIYRVYTQKSRLFARILDPDLVFHSGIPIEKYSQNLPDTQKGIHVYT